MALKSSARTILPIIIVLGVTVGLLLGRCIGGMLEEAEAAVTGPRPLSTQSAP